MEVLQEIDEIRLEVSDLKEKARELSVEQKVLLSGDVYAIFDVAHWMIYERIKENKAIPFELDGATIYYTNPSPTPKGKQIGSCGPSTSSRFDEYTPKLMDMGVICTIGKGERSQEVYAAIQKNKGVYLAAVGGAGALLSTFIESVEDIAFHELGTDCIKRLRIRDLPLIVAADCTGRNIFDIGRFKYRRL